MAKYRALFLEEATDHLAEMSQSLLVLEKDAAAQEAIETAFRMAHSIKSMAASLEYGSISALAHRLEDCMEAVRAAGRVTDPEHLALLFRGLEGLERLVGAVRDTGSAPAGDPELLAALAAARPAKKAPR
jgi:two-component system chemotaxis sensor kinase CheA